MTDDTAWMDLGACVTVGGDFWFPEKGGNSSLAKAICRRRCEVRDECLEYALAHSAGTYDVGRFGIWGGYSYEARQSMLRERKTGRAA